LVFLSVHQTLSKSLLGPATGYAPTLVFSTLSHSSVLTPCGVEFAEHAQPATGHKLDACAACGCGLIAFDIS
jgi:hypothetical protein|tara:strand:- start:2175 stop:2390 length:216 start_codon:yes stop_codon:yes gene_type:complete